MKSEPLLQMGDGRWEMGQRGPIFTDDVQRMLADATTEEGIDALERFLFSLNLPELECPLFHHFAPGIYTREIHMPAGSLIIGHRHTTSHLNVISRGRCRVMMGGVIHDLIAPCVVRSEAGVRKVLLISEDTAWLTVHANADDCTDIATLEDRLRTKSGPCLEQEARRKAMDGMDCMDGMDRGNLKSEICNLQLNKEAA